MQLLIWFSIFFCKKQEYQIKIDDELLTNVTSKLITDDCSFLRELLSNSRDALEKVALLEKDDEGFNKNRDVVLSIKDGIFTIKDCGIGMDYEDLKEFIGTMGGSGTRKFKNPENFIGQFGMGFYSTFVVADEVTIVTRKYNTDKVWQMNIVSNKKTYTLEEVDDPEHIGTTIQLKFKQTFIDNLDREEMKKWIYQNILDDCSRNYNYLMEKEEKEEEEKKEKDDGDEKKEDEEEKKEEEEEKDDDEKKEEEKVEDEEEKEENKKDEKFEKLKMFPWLTKSDKASVEEYYKAIEGHGTVATFDKRRISIRQKTPYGDYDSVGFEMLLVIPDFTDLRFLGMENKGKHMLFVNNQSIMLEDVPMFLQPMTFILKSSEAFVISTREKLLHSKKTCKDLYTSIQKKAVQLLKPLLKEKLSHYMQTYDFYIKTGYTDAKREKETSLADEIVKIIPFNTSDGLQLLGDFMKESGNEILFANVPEGSLKLPEGVYNPLVDGVTEKFILTSGFLDEQVSGVFEYEGKKMVNIMNKEFKNKSHEKNEKFVDFCKKELKNMVDEVVMSERLINAPFFVKEKHAQFSSAHKHLIGDYAIKHSVFRKTIESDIILEINPDSSEIKRIIDLMEEDYSKAVDALRTGVIASAIICDIKFPEISKAYLSIVNAQRNILGFDTVEIPTETDMSDLPKMDTEKDDDEEFKDIIEDGERVPEEMLNDIKDDENAIKIDIKNDEEEVEPVDVEAEHADDNEYRAEL